MTARPPMPLRYIRQINREVEGVTYHHRRITGLTADMEEALGWQHREELEFEIRPSGELRLRPVKKKAKEES